MLDEWKSSPLPPPTMTVTLELSGYNAAVETFRHDEYPMLRGML